MRRHFTIRLAWAITWSLSARNGLRFMRPLLLVTLVLCLVQDFVIGRAAAIEVQCIEASKYKYLYQIFGGDSKKFATYLQLDAGKLPNPEHCRAALISGGIEAPQAKDADKLLAVITQNKVGWPPCTWPRAGARSVPAISSAFWRGVFGSRPIP